MIKKAKPIKFVDCGSCENGTNTFFYEKDIIAERESIAKELEGILEKTECCKEDMIVDDIHKKLRTLVKDLANPKGLPRELRG